MKNENFIFASDLDFQASLETQSPNSEDKSVRFEPQLEQKIGLKDFTMAKFIPLKEGETPYRFQNFKTTEGHAFVFGPSHKTKDAMDALLTFAEPNSIYAHYKVNSTLEELDPSEVVACRTYKTKHGYTISGYSAHPKMMIVAYEPSKKIFTTIYTPFNHAHHNENEKVDAVNFRKENIKEGSYIFAFLANSDISAKIQKSLTTLNVTSTSIIGNYLDSISVDLNGSMHDSNFACNLFVGLKLPSKKEYKEYASAVSNDSSANTIDDYFNIVTLDLPRFKRAVANSDTKYLKDFADKYGLQAALDMVNKLVSLNDINTENNQAVRDFFQNYFNQSIKIDIQQNKDDAISEIDAFIKKSNLTFNNVNQLLVQAARTAKEDGSISKEQLQFAQLHFYQDQYRKQENARMPKKIAAIIASIAIIPLAPLFYFLYQKSKSKEEIQKTVIKLTPAKKDTSQLNSTAKMQQTMDSAAVENDMEHLLIEAPKAGISSEEKESFLYEDNSKHAIHLRKAVISDGKKVIFFGRKEQIEKVDNHPEKYATRNYTSL